LRTSKIWKTAWNQIQPKIPKHRRLTH